MIFEAIIHAVLNLIGWVIGSTLASSGLPDIPGGFFSIPSIIFFIPADTSAFIAPVSIATFIYWAWRQVKA